MTHVVLFDGSNEGIACKAKRVFSVQYHPEAAPGPSDSSLSVRALRGHDGQCPCATSGLLRSSH